MNSKDLLLGLNFDRAFNSKVFKKRFKKKERKLIKKMFKRGMITRILESSGRFDAARIEIDFVFFVTKT